MASANQNNQNISQSLLEKIMSSLGNAVNQTATVSYVGALTAEQKTQIEAKLRSLFPEITEIHYQEDITLIAGIRVQYKDYLYDDSGSGRLQSVRRQAARTVQS